MTTFLVLCNFDGGGGGRKQNHVPVVNRVTAAEFYDTKVKELPFLFDLNSIFGPTEKNSTWFRFIDNLINP